MNYFKFKIDNHLCEVELLCIGSGEAVAHIHKDDNTLLQSEFNLYSDIKASNECEYLSWDYITEQVVHNTTYYNPFAEGFEYVQNEIEEYLLTSALWRELKV